MSKNQKNPTRKIIPSTNKEPKIASSPTGYYHLRPSWRISKLEMAEPYGWHTLDIQKLSYIQGKLAHFESMTWDEILIKSKKFNHSIATNKLSSDAQRRLREINQDDIDELVSLRLTGVERVWGILDQGILTLIWWDPNHNVCPSLLKHT
jgi:hypothetical protein